MPFPVDVNALGSVSGSQTLAAAGHATRHNEVKTALEGIRDALGGTAVPSGTVQPILAAGSASAPSLSFTGDSNTGLWSPAADTVAFSTGGTERMRIDNAGLITGTGTSLGAWTAYTPALGGTGWAIGNGTVAGAYRQIGKMVFFWASFTMGSTSTSGAGALAFTIPVNQQTTNTVHIKGRAVDTSTGATYALLASTSNSTQFQVRVQSADANLVTVTNSGTPTAWADTDVFQICGVYEAA